MKHLKSIKAYIFAIVIAVSFFSCSHYFSNQVQFNNFTQHRVNHDSILYQQLIALKNKPQKIQVSQYSYNQSEYNYFSGLVFEEKNDFDQAVKFYKQGVNKSQLFQEDCYLHLAAIYLMTGNTSAAVKLKKKNYFQKLSFDEYYKILFQQIDFIIDLHTDKKSFGSNSKAMIRLST